MSIIGHIKEAAFTTYEFTISVQTMAGGAPPPALHIEDDDPDRSPIPFCSRPLYISPVIDSALCQALRAAAGNKASGRFVATVAASTPTLGAPETVPGTCDNFLISLSFTSPYFLVNFATGELSYLSPALCRFLIIFSFFLFIRVLQVNITRWTLTATQSQRATTTLTAIQHMLRAVCCFDLTETECG
jgi:hypothetical protein